MIGHRISRVAHHSPDLLAIAVTAIAHASREGIAGAFPEISGFVALSLLYAIGDDIFIIIRRIHRSK